MEKTKKPMEYTFVYRDNGWWLKINTIEQLMDYHEKNDDYWAKGFNSLFNSKEFTRDGTEHVNAVGSAIGFYSENRGLNPIEATLNLRASVMNTQTKLIEEGQELYINKKGGYNFDYDDRGYEQFLKRKELIFPDFKENEIRIEKFPYGTHFYAYIGDMQLRDGDKVKWNTQEDARKFAEKYVSKVLEKESSDNLAVREDNER